MNKPWEQDNCAAMRALHEAYSIPQAAALWCEVPHDELETILSEAEQVSQSGPGRSIWEHPGVPCLKPRTQAIAEAIESGALPHGREDGKPVESGEHIAHERRHILGRNLREWMEKAFPNEKPEFLFYDIERNTHHAITIESYESLKAEKEALARQAEDYMKTSESLMHEKKRLEKELESIKSQFEGNEPPAENAEVTYQILIAALIETILGEIPGNNEKLEFKSQAQLIDFLSTKFDGYYGMKKRTLQTKFPRARAALIQSK